jgi:hypothetical protein
LVIPTLEPRLEGLTKSGSGRPRRTRRSTAVASFVHSASNDPEGDDGKTLVAEDGLGQRLVHAEGRAGDAGPDVGDVGHLEKSLDRAVLAEGTVKDGKIDVRGRPRDRRSALPGEE